MNQTDDNISGAITQLILKEQFFAHLLGNLSREISDRTPTIGLEKTHGGYNLIVNPEYFDQFLPTICHANCYTKALQACRERTQNLELGLKASLEITHSPEEVQEVLEEVQEEIEDATKEMTKKMRVAAVKHEALHFVFNHVFRAEEYENQEIYNLAADLVVNQYLDPWPSLPEAFTLELLQEAGIILKNGESVGYYYEELLKILQQGFLQEEENPIIHFPVLK